MPGSGWQPTHATSLKLVCTTSRTCFQPRILLSLMRPSAKHRRASRLQDSAAASRSPSPQGPPPTGCLLAFRVGDRNSQAVSSQSFSCVSINESGKEQGSQRQRNKADGSVSRGAAKSTGGAAMREQDREGNGGDVGIRRAGMCGKCEWCTIHPAGIPLAGSGRCAEGAHARQGTSGTCGAEPIAARGMRGGATPPPPPAAPPFPP